MDSKSQSKPGYHTWEVHCRPKDAKHELWQIKRVAARSAIQAEAILRRYGYEVLLESAVAVYAEPDPITVAKLQPIRCIQCNYLLTGLSIEFSYVVCPECAYQQPVVAWNPEIQPKVDRNHPVIWIFAFLGMAGFGFFVLLFFLPIVV